MIKRAVLYARVCVDDGQNLVEQLTTCRKHTQELDWNIVKELAEQGAGNSSVNLPQLNYIQELAQAGEFDMLVVRDPYRLSRELARLVNIEAQLMKHDIEIEYLMPGDSNTLTGEMMQVIAGLAQVCRRKRPKK